MSDGECDEGCPRDPSFSRELPDSSAGCGRGHVSPDPGGRREGSLSGWGT